MLQEALPRLPAHLREGGRRRVAVGTKRVSKWMDTDCLD
jgi:hypothetical protein